MKYLSLYLVSLCIGMAPISHASNAVEQALQNYRDAGANEFNSQAGAEMWVQSFPNNRSCTSCHGKNTSQNGKHVKTKKLIKPMALSVNSERYSSVKKINKWFKRNCKWTLGRECSPQEKGDFLTWLVEQ